MKDDRDVVRDWLPLYSGPRLDGFGKDTSRASTNRPARKDLGQTGTAIKRSDSRNCPDRRPGPRPPL